MNHYHFIASFFYIRASPRHDGMLRNIDRERKEERRRPIEREREREGERERERERELHELP